MLTADIEAVHSTEFVLRCQALIQSRSEIDSPPLNHRHNCREVSTQTSSRDTERLNICQPLWLPPVDLVDTITAPSYENYGTGNKRHGIISHMNMRNGSVVFFTISKRGNRSFAIGVAVCLRESDGRGQKSVSSGTTLPSILEYLFHSFSACFSATWKFATGNEIKSR